MINWPYRAMEGLAYLFRPYNDIDVFVEDTTYKSLYEIIINRTLDGRAKLRSVICMGGRRAVLEKCRQDQGSKVKNRIYIIDADFDLLLGARKPKFKMLHRLNAYCIENLVIQEEALVEVVYESGSMLDKEQISVQLDFDKWIKDVNSVLLPLYTKYAVAQKYGANIKTSDYSVLALCEGRGPAKSVSKKKVARRMSAVQTAILRKTNGTNIVKNEKQIRARLPLREINRSRRVSGKTYLLPLIHLKITSEFKFPDSSHSLKGRLARHCKLPIDAKLESALLTAAGL